MPPPRKAHLPEANRIFVNRERPIAAFEDAARAVAPEASSLLVFYGIGGQGKSALARELRRRCSLKEHDPYRDLRCAELDLHGRPSSDPEMLMVWLRNAFADAGIPAPCFDLTLGIQWAAQRPEQPLPELRSSWFTRESTTLALTATDLLSVAKDVASEQLQGIPIFGGLVRRAGRWAIRRGYEAYLHSVHEPLKELYRAGELKKPYEITALLPWMLAQDLNAHQQRYPDERCVLFIDEYERVFTQGGAAESWSANPFDRNMRSLIAESNGLLAVFFTRERLPWEDDSDWADMLAGRQHLLGGLTAADADRYLAAIPIADAALRKAMIAGARETMRPDAAVYPFMLDLQVEHWRQCVARRLSASPESFDIAAPDFRNRRREIVERVLRDYDPPLQATLRRLACARRFDRAAFDQVVSTFRTGLPGDSFDTVTQLSFAAQGDDGFVAIQSVMAEAIREMLEPERRAEAVAVLFRHYETRARVASHFDVTDATIAALNEAAYLRREQGIAGYAEWLESFTEQLRTAARFGAGFELWREALAAIETRSAPSEGDLTICLNALGEFSNFQGDYEAAHAFYTRGLAIGERIWGARSPRIVGVLSNLAGVLSTQGDLPGAKALLLRALAIREAQSPPDEAGLAVLFNNLAEIMSDLSDYDGARRMFERSLAIREKVHGPDHAATATALNNLGRLHDTMGDYKTAQALLERSLAIREKVLGPRHPITAVSINNLANLHVQLGDYETAKPLHERSVRIREETLGTHHPDVATALNNLAFTLSNLHDHAGALRLQHRALEIDERVFGVGHSRTASCIAILAYLYRRSGDLAAARPYYEQALALREKTLGPDHPQTGFSLNALAVCLNEIGELDSAASLFLRALAVQEQKLGPSHPATARTLGNLAKLYADQGKFDDARLLFERALAISEKVFGPQNQATTLLARNFHGMLVKAGDSGAALALVEKFGAEIATTPAPKAY